MDAFPPDPTDSGPECARCSHCGRTYQQADSKTNRCPGCQAAFKSEEPKFPCVSKCCRGAEPVQFPRYTNDVFLDLGE